MLYYLDVKSTDPAWNLALEQYVFEALPREGTYFLLWQNDRSVIVGRHQDTLAEINENYIRAHGIPVVRRLSGGGAVYHDLGNLNYSFIADASDAGKLDFSLFCRPVVSTLASLGVEARLGGRNDISVGGKKISGNAQYIRGGRLLQHGTILFDSDLEAVSQALRVDEDKIRTKGIRSVRSRMTNVREHLKKPVSLDAFRSLLLTRVLEAASGGSLPEASAAEASGMPGGILPEASAEEASGMSGGILPEASAEEASGSRPAVLPLRFSPEDSAAVEAIRAGRYAAWDWNYGQSPAGSLVKRRRVEGCGLVEVCISMEGGLIRNAAFRGDFFSLADPDQAAARLIGIRPEPAAYAQALEGLDASRYISGLTTDMLLTILCS